MQSNHILNAKLPPKDFILFAIASLLIAWLLTSCKTTQEFNKEYIYVHDTVYRLDTTLVIKSDSIWLKTPCRDTIIYKETPKMVLKTIVKDNIVYVEAKCKEQQYYISKEIAARSVTKLKHDKEIVTKYRIPFWIWIVLGIIALPAAYGGFRLASKFL